MDISLKRMAYVHHKGPFYKPHHTHELCELAYYVKGHGTLAEGEKQYQYTKGTVHLVGAGIPHDENNEMESNIILLYFEVPDGFIPSGIYSDQNGAVLSLLQRLRVEMQENLAFKQEMADCMVLQILLTLKRKLLPQPAESQNFNRVVQYIDENFQSEIDIHTIAEQTFYSYDRFRHVFKEHTGCAPLEYINNKRIELAQLLMEMNPAVPLGDLAAECGFSGLSQFSNAFRAKTGISPSRYKKQIKERQPA
ncbi:MAG: helix-turn-helix domain-containing protein [Clostridia bacterium]|nr:helix-turn-helix domain-containing protein [Clostridia bacterium]